MTKAVALHAAAPEPLPSRFSPGDQQENAQQPKQQQEEQQQQEEPQQSHQQPQQTQHGPQAPLCRHWGRTGSCLQGAACRFAHPADVVPMDAPRRRHWGGRRATVRNRSRATAFRRHLIDAFGRDLLRSGSGVLDVAGGKGEISFQLFNLNSIPSTVVDPRPLRLKQFERRAKLGIYHNTGPYASYTDVPLEHLSVRGGAPPGHARIFLDMPLVEALGRLSAARRVRLEGREGVEGAAGDEAATCEVVGDGGSRPGLGEQQQQQQQEQQGQQEQQQQQQQLCDGALGTQESAAGRGGRAACTSRGPSCGGGDDSDEEEATDCEPDWSDEAACLARVRQLLSASLQRAAAVEWTTHGLQEHEGEAVAGTARRRGKTAADGRHSAGASDEEDDEENEEAEALQWLLQGREGLGAAGEPLRSCKLDETTASVRGNGGGSAIPEPSSAIAAENSAATEDAPGDPCAQQALDALIDRLLSCSCVAALHPDAATEPAVRLALALCKPWAVVPCCVYAAQFPGRRLASGAAVRTHQELVAYLLELAEGTGMAARAAPLPFEGKNVVVWSAPAPTDELVEGAAGGLANLKVSPCNVK